MRIRAVLRSYSIDKEEADWKRVIPIPGDLSKPHLGLSSDEFGALAGQVDMIFHNGALVNFIYPYSELKGPNVLGTQEVLRLACEGKPKPVHYISTLAVFSGTRDKNKFLEADEIDSGGLTNGYVQSKWVAERLIDIGRQRGIPATIYRLGRVTGHSKTGASNESDLFARVIKSCIQTGQAPDLDMATDLTPVDFVCRAIVQLARSSVSVQKNYHLVSGEFIRWNSLVQWIQSLGYELKRTSFENWVGGFAKENRNGHDNALIPLLPIFEGRSIQGDGDEVKEQIMASPFECSNAFGDLAPYGIACPPASAELFQTYMRYFMSSGFIEAPKANAESPAHLGVGRG